MCNFVYVYAQPHSTYELHIHIRATTTIPVVIRNTRRYGNYSSDKMEYNFRDRINFSVD